MLIVFFYFTSLLLFMSKAFFQIWDVGAEKEIPENYYVKQAWLPGGVNEGVLVLLCPYREQEASSLDLSPPYEKGPF